MSSGDGPTTQDTEGGEWRRILVRLAVTVLVLGGVYVGAAWYLGQHVANGTTVAGVDIGGRTPEGAAEHLRTQLEGTATAPVEVQVGEDVITIDPREAGLRLDLESTLDGLVGTTYHPGELWQHLRDEGEAHPLRVAIDDDRLTGALEQAATQVDTQVVEGSVAFEDGRVRTTMSRDGRSLDVAGTAEEVRQAWPRQSRIKGVVEVHEPELAAEEVSRFTEEFAEPAMSAPVRLVVDDRSTDLTTAQLSRLLTVEVGPDGRLGATLDQARFMQIVHEALPDLEQQPRNATVVLADGRPEVVEARPGRTLDHADVVEAVTAALTSEQRTATVETSVVRPEVSTEDAQAWGVDEVVAQFRSTLPTGPEDEDRTHNIRTALSHLNGVLVRPGEQFSLLEHLAPFTAEKGYREAGVIVDGRLTQGMAGGVSQVSTVVFNTAFFAGVQLDEYTPHAYYIARYPEGREATLWNPTIDNVWTNDSGHAILVQGWVEGNEVVMRFWGTKVYDIDAHKGERRNVVESEEVEDDSPECMSQAPVEGFDVTVTRVFRQDGERVRSQDFTTRYEPSDEVTCTHPDAG